MSSRMKWLSEWSDREMRQTVGSRGQRQQGVRGGVRQWVGRGPQQGGRARADVGVARAQRAAHAEGLRPADKRHGTVLTPLYHQIPLNHQIPPLHQYQHLFIHIITSSRRLSGHKPNEPEGIWQCLLFH